MYRLQILVVTEEFGGLLVEQYALHRQFAAATVFVHRHLCPAGNASVWGSVQLQPQSGQTSQQF